MAQVNNDTVLEIIDNGMVSYSEYRGQLDLCVIKENKNLYVHLINLKEISAQRCFVRVFLYPKKSKSKKTSVTKLKQNCHNLNESFRFSVSGLRSRLLITVHSVNEVTKKNKIIGAMSFSANKPQRILAKGCYFLLDSELGKTRHMKVRETDIAKWNTENNTINKYLTEQTFIIDCSTATPRSDLASDGATASYYSDILESDDDFYNNVRLSETSYQSTSSAPGLYDINMERMRDGFGFKLRGDHPTVICEIQAGSSAHQAGLRIGDVIAQVEDISIVGLQCSQIVKIIRYFDQYLKITVWRR